MLFSEYICEKNRTNHYTWVICRSIYVNVDQYTWVYKQWFLCLCNPMILLCTDIKLTPSHTHCCIKQSEDRHWQLRVGHGEWYVFPILFPGVSKPEMWAKDLNFLASLSLSRTLWLREFGRWSGTWQPCQSHVFKILHSIFCWFKHGH